MKFINQVQKKITVSAIVALLFTFVLSVTLLDSCCIVGTPGFKKTPIVKDVNSTKILVSWKDSMNDNFECADEFYVYLWKSNNETRGDAVVHHIHHRISTNFSYELTIDVSENTNYTFLIEARETYLVKKIIAMPMHTIINAGSGARTTKPPNADATPLPPLNDAKIGQQ